MRDICEAVHLKSTSSVHSHLETLEKNGYIRRDPTKPRAIEIMDDSFNLSRREVVNVPMVGTVAAGQPILAQEHIEGYFPIPAEYMPNTDCFMLKVKGESMINAGIFDGDYIILLRLRLFIKKTATIVSSRRTIPWIRSLWMMYRFLEKYVASSVFSCKTHSI